MIGEQPQRLRIPGSLSCPDHFKRCKFFGNLRLRSVSGAINPACCNLRIFHRPAKFVLGLTTLSISECPAKAMFGTLYLFLIIKTIEEHDMCALALQTCAEFLRKPVL